MDSFSDSTYWRCSAVPSVVRIASFAKGSANSNSKSKTQTAVEREYEPCVVNMLEDPQSSFADIELYGFDSAEPIHAHRSVLVFRAKHFENLFTYQSAQEAFGPRRFTLEDISTKALRLIVRRIYGEKFPTSSWSEEQVPMIIEILYFATVRFLEQIRCECEALIEQLVTQKYFGPCFRTAVTLQNRGMQKFLTRKIEVGEALNEDVLQSFGVDDILALHSSRAHMKSIDSLSWADAWIEYDHERSLFEPRLVEAFPYAELSKSKFRELPTLKIFREYASRYLLFIVLSHC